MDFMTEGELLPMSAPGHLPQGRIQAESIMALRVLESIQLYTHCMVPLQWHLGRKSPGGLSVPTGRHSRALDILGSLAKPQSIQLINNMYLRETDRISSPIILNNTIPKPHRNRSTSMMNPSSTPRQSCQEVPRQRLQQPHLTITCTMSCLLERPVTCVGKQRSSTETLNQKPQKCIRISTWLGITPTLTSTTQSTTNLLSRMKRSSLILTRYTNTSVPVHSTSMNTGQLFSQSRTPTLRYFQSNTGLKTTGRENSLSCLTS